MLIEKYFEDVTEANASSPRSPPLGYFDQKEILKVGYLQEALYKIDNIYGK